MSVELAKEIINRELGQNSEIKKYQIELAGGEPFLYFDDLKEIVAYGVYNAPIWKKELYFFISTNLTLLNNEIKDWLEQNRCFVILGTSLDGTKEAHDICRNGSYDAVIKNIPFYKRLYPFQKVKMTIGPETVSSIYNGITDIETMGLSVDANVVFEPVWGDTKKKKYLLEQFADQLDLLVEHYANKPGLSVPNLLTLPINLLTGPPDPEYRWCGSGRTMRAYDTDGHILPCHRFAGFCTNRIYEGERSIYKRVMVKCDSCDLIYACPTCSGYNWQENFHPSSRTSYHCEFIKLQLIATAKLKYLLSKQLISQLASNPSISVANIPLDALNTIKSVNYVLHRLDVDEIISII